MSNNNYESRGTKEAESLVSDLFDLGKVGYVALGAGPEVLMRMAPEAAHLTETTAESNFFEELLVNPTLLKLASQRANLDCGGLNYIAVGYSDFIQFLAQTRDGHVSIGVASETDVPGLADKVRAVLARHDRLPPKHQTRLRP